MVENSTLLYIIDNTSKFSQNEAVSVNNFINETNNLLESIFGKLELSVDNKILDKVLSQI